MKIPTKILAAAIVAASTLFAISIWKNSKKVNFDKNEIMDLVLRDSSLTRDVLLDSGLIRVQADLLEDDSVMSVFVINHLELRPELARRIVHNLYRHKYINEDELNNSLERIQTDEYMSCCL